MAIPLSRGKPYMTLVTLPNVSAPVENDILSFNIGPKYSFTAGNSVIIAGRFNMTFRFEAIVDEYNATTGAMTIVNITNIVGTYTQVCTITLAGQRGSKIVGGSGVPSVSVGRSGDMYIDTTTGEVYLKS
jgi:hypothetical protein